MSLQEFKCPNCGGAIGFDPSMQTIYCPYCSSVLDMQAVAASEAELANQQPPEATDWGLAGTEWGAGEQDHLSVYTCNSCAGEIVGDDTLGATSCPFCGNPVVMTSKFSGTLRPDMIIPFKYGKEQAMEALKKHYLKKVLLPKVFKNENHLEEIKGVYVPFWLYDSDVDAHIMYTATKTRSWSDSRNNYTETSYYDVMRDGSIGFSSLPVDGSKAIDDTLMESVEPYYVGESVAFNTPYLAGYFANKYDVTPEENQPRAYERFKNSTTESFKSTVTGYDTVKTKHANVRFRNGRVKYALYPVWLLSTTWNESNFLFALNGQTGKLVGDLPMDKKAFGLWFLILFAAPFVGLLLLFLKAQGVI